MDTALPHFRYHPDPVATGVVVPSTTRCVCCGRARGWIYTGPVYGPEGLDAQLCPWCIADGHAASRHAASFADSDALHAAGVAQSVVDEVNLLTPGYPRSDTEDWLVHCGDACEYHGVATLADLEGAGAPTLQAWCAHHGRDAAAWQALLEDRRTGLAVTAWRFRCRHCGLLLIGYEQPD